MDKIVIRCKEIRNKLKLSQQEIANKFNCERSLISKYESGKINIPDEYIKFLEQLSSLNISNLKDDIIIDTSVLMKRPKIIGELFEDYNKIIIPDIVLDELNYIKDKKENNTAWLALKEIDAIKEKIEIIKADKKYKENDLNIINLANELEKTRSSNIYIISDDIGYSTRYKKSIFFKEYTNRENIFCDVKSLEELDKLYLKDWTNYKLPNSININGYLSNGYTLLISCIYSKNKYKYKKMHYLIKNGIDINMVDKRKYYLPPISHAIQKNDKKAFNILMGYNADYNKQSRNPNRTECTRAKNEGNTPLMIACWHKRDYIINALLKKDDISINQQDSNGYTALIKSAKQKSKNICNILIEKGADIKIFDRNGKDYKWWLENGK